ncbi:MAG: RNA-guided endonuclease InsQ/TnpB family protein [Nitrosotalea sp.]
MFAYKAVKQQFTPIVELDTMMETFRQMVNECIKIGLDANISTLGRFSSLHYKDLNRCQIQSKYKLTAMSQAMGRLAQRKRDIEKGRNPKSPYVNKPYLVSCYGFKINGMLLSIPIGNRDKLLVMLNDHTVSKLKGVEPRSFTITPNSLSISIRKEVNEIKPQSVIGIDRNLRNVTISTREQPIMYKTGKLLSIKENAVHVIASFRRNDRRVKGKFYSQKKNRRSRRVQQFLHKISKDIVSRAVQSSSMIVLEDIKGIRKLYRKGNGQGNKFRRRLNSWSFYELQRQVQYKAAWKGIPVQFVDPRCTSQLCPICGDRIQEDRLQLRKLWCTNCKRSIDRDVVASMNIAYKGWSRFCHPRGLAVDAMKGKVDILTPLILRVDGSKLSEEQIIT